MEKSYLQSSSDGLKLAVECCEPKNQPFKGLVQLVHGMCEHKERYHDFMTFLADNGYVTVIHDLRGHGESVLQAKDLGFMYKGGWKALVEDIRDVNTWAKYRYPGLKCILFGHSMGSMAVRSFVKRYDSLIDELFVCGSPSNNPAASIGKLLADAFSFFMGDHHRPQLLQNMSFGAYNKPFKNEGYASAWICSDKDILDRYHSDPLCQYVFTANGFSNLMGLMKDCYSAKDWKVSKPDMSVHFISGQLDPCRGNDALHNSSVELMKTVGYNNVDSKIYPGMRHEILNETDKAVVWNDILKAVLK